NAAPGGAGGHGGHREVLPRCPQPAADPGEPHAQHVLSRERVAPAADPAPDRAERAPGHAHPGNQGPAHDRAAERPVAEAGAAGPPRAPARSRRFRSLHHPPEQRPVGGRAGDSPGSPRAGRAAAPARRLGRAPQVEPLPGLCRGRQAFRQADRHRSLADQPAVCDVRRGDFHARTGEECLATNVDMLLRQLRSKYREYKIAETPFIVVKADAGTYGMGVMTVRDASEVQGLNRKQRNKMAVGKEGREVHEVLIQAGVHTFETVDGAVAEPVVYMVDRFVVGGFYRIHAERGRDENLNAAGMQFRPLPFDASCVLPEADSPPDHAPNRFYAYGVVARLALLAASIELERTDPDPSLYG